MKEHEQESELIDASRVCVALMDGNCVWILEIKGRMI
jgi:hypothetical protein